jgi:hypothetical protein
VKLLHPNVKAMPIVQIHQNQCVSMVDAKKNQMPVQVMPIVETQQSLYASMASVRVW